MAVVGLFVCNPTARAAIVFQDNFQTDAAVLSDSSDDADPVIDTVGGDIGGAWQIIESPALSAQVENDVTPGTPASGSGTNNYLRVYRGGGPSGRGAPFARDWDAAATLDQVVQLDMLVFQPTGTVGMDVFFGSTLPSGTPNSGVNNFANASPVQVYLGADLPDDQWLSVQIKANFSSTTTQFGILPQQFMVSIGGGTPTASAFFLAANQTPAILVGLSETNETFNYIDDVVIQILSPPTAHPGDFDSDGDVDGADFVAWQTNFPKASGAVLADGDADGDGDVDGADFVVWQTNFPFTPGPGIASVPEPNSLALVWLGGLSIVGVKRLALAKSKLQS